MEIILDLLAAFLSIGSKECWNLHSANTVVEGRQTGAPCSFSILKEQKRWGLEQMIGFGFERGI